MMNMYENAWKNIVKPPQIKTKKHLLGPVERNIQSSKIIRTDLQVVNRNNKKLSGFIFHAPQLNSNETILYLHGNGGSKIEAVPLVQFIPKFKINIAAFDLPGCGSSDQETLTYGINEVFDIRDILQEIRKVINVSRVTLWGRSMGAMCSVMFAEMYSYQVNGLILDSPFRNLSNVIDRIAVRETSIPQIFIKPILYFIKKKAIQQANYDIFSIDYLSIFKKLNQNLPVLFIFSHFDGIVPAEQVFEFYNTHKGPKDFCQIYQTHDEDRNEDLFKQGMMWLTRTKKKNIEGMIQARQNLYTCRKQKNKNTNLC